MADSRVASVSEDKMRIEAQKEKDEEAAAVSEMIEQAEASASTVSSQISNLLRLNLIVIATNYQRRAS